jgi:flagellar export protein FliJ
VKRYKFRLNQVLRVRSIELDRAVGEVAKARLEANEARRRTQAREQTYRDLSTAPVGPTVDDLRKRRLHQEMAADAIIKARQAERLADQLVEVRLAEWAEADRKVRLLEQLDERSRARHTAEVLAEEQQVLDDLVTSRQARA